MWLELPNPALQFIKLQRSLDVTVTGKVYCSIYCHFQLLKCHKFEIRTVKATGQANYSHRTKQICTENNYR